MHNLIIVRWRAPIMAAGLWAMLAASASDAAMADDQLNYAGPARKQDEVFIVSTRALGVPAAEAPSLTISRFNERDQWQPLSLDAFVDDQRAGSATLIYVHGYDFSEKKAERFGWAFYHEFCDDLPADERVRFVIWSWPTVAKKFRPVRDFIDKTHRSDADAYYLAWFISQLPADTRVGVAGSALGCQVVQGTLHLLGGGALTDLKLPRHDHPLPALSTVFIAPAVHNDWLYPGEFHERAIDGTSRLLLVNNPTDAALCRYGQPWKSKPVALGQSGLTDLRKLGELASRIEQLDASEQIGEEHGVEYYLREPQLVARMRNVLLSR